MVDGAAVGRPNQRSAWRSHHRCGCEAAGASIASRLGEITPAFAAAFGAGIDVVLLRGARNAQARAFATFARSGRRAAGGSVLPVEIPTTQACQPAGRARDLTR
jgi:hypothetical protein